MVYSQFSVRIDSKPGRSIEISPIVWELGDMDGMLPKGEDINLGAQSIIWLGGGLAAGGSHGS